MVITSCSDIRTQEGKPIEIEIYPTKAEAEAVAPQLNCTGAHSMGEGWMPCDSHDPHNHN